MSILLAFWLLSLVLLVGVLLYANTKKDTLAQGVPDSFGGFLFEEIKVMGEELSRGFAHVRPHGERAITKSGVLIKKGHNMLIEKAFGRIAIEKGKASSFFLKRIAEHKEALNGKARKEI